MRHPVLLALPVLLMACDTPPPASGDLPLFGNGYRADGDQCRRVGESAYTNQFLDDAADLVACPEDYEGVGVFETETGAVQVAFYQGYFLYSVPRY